MISNIARIIEKILENVLQQYYKTNCILSPSQFGFLPREVITNISLAVYCALDNNTKCTTVCLNF